MAADVRLRSREEGYAVQACLEAHSGNPLHGWKIAAIVNAGQTHININEPITGRIFAERVISDAGIMLLGPSHMGVAGAELPLARDATCIRVLPPTPAMRCFS